MRGWTVFLALALMYVTGLAACAPQAGPPSPTAAAQISGDDRSAAEALWAKIQAAKYRENWATIPGKGTFYQPLRPHGVLASTYLSPGASEALKARPGQMPDGAAIVRETYTADKTPRGVGVMLKRQGYDPAHKDWFWATYSPAGEVRNAGKIQSCNACHATVRSNDAIFTFPVASLPAPEVPATEKDKSMAQDLWQKMQTAKYRDNWDTVPGKGTFYKGQPPHGALLSTYLNPQASEALKTMPGQASEGAIIVKENYTPDKALADTTVMYKVPGYDPQHNDWFYADYGPDGKVNMAGKAQYCISCHGAVQSNDYIFDFPMNPPTP
ncbi:MAG: cytochrome P460 family protein [Chloroflexi bacterium]|nr:cytochrome P460 family protein [Chloroflexota bacterium]